MAETAHGEGRGRGLGARPGPPCTRCSPLCARPFPPSPRRTKGGFWELMPGGPCAQLGEPRGPPVTQRGAGAGSARPRRVLHSPQLLSAIKKAATARSVQHAPSASSPSFAQPFPDPGLASASPWIPTAPAPRVRTLVWGWVAIAELEESLDSPSSLTFRALFALSKGFPCALPLL